MSRYPAVNELFDKANGLRPKLALSEQVSHPTWTRSPPVPQPSGYQPVNAGYNHVHQTPNGSYGSWAPSQAQPQGHAQAVSGNQQYGEHVHTPRYAAPLAPSAPPPAEVQAQWQQQQHSVTTQSSTASPPPSSVLTRHNTATYSSSRANHPTNNLLARHNTVAAPPPQAQQQPSLPAFPVVPTSAPQSFPMYGSSIPQSAPQPERKEALLIDL